MELTAGVLKDVGTNRQRNTIYREQLAAGRTAQFHAGRRETNIGAMISDEETGGAAGVPFEEKHAELVAIRAGPIAAAAFVVTQESLSGFLDRDFLPVRRRFRPLDAPGRELRGPRFMGAIPDFRAGFGGDSQEKQSGQGEPRDMESSRRRRHFLNVVILS